MKISQRNDTNTISKALAVFIWLVLLVVVVATILSISHAFKAGNEQTAQEEDQRRKENVQKLKDGEIDRQTTIDRLAPQYCKTHQDTITTFEDTSYPSNDGSGWTSAECSRIVALLYDDGSSAQNIENIINKRVWIGMNETEVWYSLGNPNDINTSNYGGIVSRQLVYGYNYIYTDGNGIVTSYQL